MAATDSFLSADREEARIIASRDETIDQLEEEIERLSSARCCSRLPWRATSTG